MKRLLSVGLVGAVSWLTACSAEEEPASRPRPAIDRAAPAKTETATFALG
jgi:hypothetical protein